MGTGTTRRSFAEYLELLKAFNHHHARALIVGGQAVNFWAELFQEEETELRQYRPFTSSDLDLHRPDNTARAVLQARSGLAERERDPFGKAFTIVSHTFLIQDADGHILTVDELKMVAGLRPEELEKGAMVVEFSGAAVHVLNPICCLKAKFYNLRTLEQQDRQDLKHVRILVACLRAFVRRLLVEGNASGNYRPVLNALQQTLICTSGRNVVNTARLHGIDLTKSLPLVELMASDEPRIARFSHHHLAKWRCG